MKSLKHKEYESDESDEEISDGTIQKHDADNLNNHFYNHMTCHIHWVKKAVSQKWKPAANH